MPHFITDSHLLTADTAFYLISAALQLAAMVFAVLMMRVVDDRRPWILLFLALLIMFVMRIVAIFVPLTLRQHVNPLVAGPVSLLLLMALFSLRRIAANERESRIAAARSAAERDESDRRYRALVEMSPDALFVNSGGHIVYANAAAAKFFRAPAVSDLIGKRHVDLIAPESRALAESRIRQLNISGTVLPAVEEKWIRFDGTTVEVESNAAEVSWQGGRGIQISLRDITLRKEEERERAALLASERAARSIAEHANRMKDEFLATLSHELRTPLNAILGWANMLRQNAAIGDMKQGLDVIERNARMQTKLIEDLLDMSRIIAGKLRLEVQQIMPIIAIEAAIQTVRPAAEAKGIQLVEILDRLAGPVNGDAQRLQQVVWNLLSNAIKFTPRDGKVTVTLQRVGSQIEISVTDTGQGIAPEFLTNVFDRFRQADASLTRKHGGLGIGLSIVKQLVELHGGTVQATSNGMETGSRFVVLLPVSSVHIRHNEGGMVAPRAVNGNQARPFGIDLSGLRVVVVDDELDAGALVKHVLSECQADVKLATGAAAGLQLVETERPDILISDIGMPDVDGYEFLRRVRSLSSDRGGRVPAIALTAFARTEDRTRSLMAGYSTHISKPVEPQELVATVASLTGRTG